MPLPNEVKKVVALINNPSSTGKMLTEAISAEPVLAARLLRAANSPLFGLVGNTPDLGSAIVRLGINQVRSIVLGIGISRMFSGGIDLHGYSRVNLWKHSVAVGTMSQAMTTACPVTGIRKMATEALLTGLVHDIGILIEDQYLPQKAGAQVASTAFMLKESLPVVENQEFGWTHASIGGLVLAKWKFDAEVVTAVTMHHGGPGLPENLLGTMTAMSEFLVARAAMGYCDISPEQVPHDDFEVLQMQLGLMGPGLDRLQATFTERIGDALQIFS